MTKTAQKPVRSREIVERSFDFRSVDGGDGLTLEGYAAVFDTPTRIEDWEPFDEIIARGAFKKTLAERSPILQWNHGNDPAVGQVPIGNIETIREDANGLKVTARLHDNAQVGPIRDAIASGAITGMSFRFQVLNEQVDTSGDIPVRTVREVRLFEVGPVAFPAYPTTSVGVRSIGTDDDADPGTIAQAVDAAIDEALDELNAGNIEQGIALLGAADISIDALLSLLGVADPDEMNSSTSPAAAEDGTTKLAGAAPLTSTRTRAALSLALQTHKIER